MGINSSLKHFANNLFNQSEKNNADEKNLDSLEPVAANSALQYVSDTQNALQECARALHGFTNPKDIGYYVMKTLREFHGADYVCVLEVNLDNWFLRWVSREGSDTLEEDNSKRLIHYTTNVLKYINQFCIYSQNIMSADNSDNSGPVTVPSLIGVECHLYSLEGTSPWASENSLCSFEEISP